MKLPKLFLCSRSLVQILCNLHHIHQTLFKLLVRRPASFTRALLPQEKDVYLFKDTDKLGTSLNFAYMECLPDVRNGMLRIS